MGLALNCVARGARLRMVTTFLRARRDALVRLFVQMSRAFEFGALFHMSEPLPRTASSSCTAVGIAVRLGWARAAAGFRGVIRTFVSKVRSVEKFSLPTRARAQPREMPTLGVPPSPNAERSWKSECPPSSTKYARVKEIPEFREPPRIRETGEPYKNLAVIS